VVLVGDADLNLFNISKTSFLTIILVRFSDAWGTNLVPNLQISRTIDLPKFVARIDLCSVEFEPQTQATLGSHELESKQASKCRKFKKKSPRLEGLLRVILKRDFIVWFAMAGSSLVNIVSNKAFLIIQLSIQIIDDNLKLYDFKIVAPNFLFMIFFVVDKAIALCSFSETSWS
jgi:hypothetical protein